MASIPGGTFAASTPGGSFTENTDTIGVVDALATGTSAQGGVVVLAPDAVASGLAALLDTASPIDQLLNLPDALGRFRTEPGIASAALGKPAEASVIAPPAVPDTRDIYIGPAVIAAASTPAAPLARADAATTSTDIPPLPIVIGQRGDAAGVGAAATAAVPERIVDVGNVPRTEAGRIVPDIGHPPAATREPLAATTPAPPITSAMATGVSSLTATVTALAGVVDYVAVPTAPPAAAKPGTVLIYAAATGEVALQLRTASGYTDRSATSPVPLTGDRNAMSGNGFNLVGVYGTATGVVDAARMQMQTATRLDSRAVATSTQQLVSPGMNQAPTRQAGSGAVPTSAGLAGSANAAAAATTQAATTGAAALAGYGVAGGPGAAWPTSRRGGVEQRDGSAAARDGRSASGRGASNGAGTARPYIYTIWYDILAQRFEAQGVRLPLRSAVLRDVVWATAIEHGPFASPDGDDILTSIAVQLDLPTASDAAIIAAIFTERARQDGAELVHYTDVLPFDRDRVATRLADESKIALAQLA